MIPKLSEASSFDEALASLDECKRADAHLRAACAATLAHDDAAYRRHMDLFNAISSGWRSNAGTGGQQCLPAAEGKEAA